VLALGKGEAKDDLLALRRRILEEHAPGARLVELADPERDRTPDDYDTTVRDWHAARAGLISTALRHEVGEDGVAAMLVWGDPSLYDSTLRIVEQLTVPVRSEVIPGITSVQALTAAHGIVLNQVGRPVLITTGRLLAQGWPAGVDDVVVMLDADCSWQGLDEPLDLWWGAYLGSADEVLVAGDAHERLGEIRALRADLRARKGWIMDVTLLRRRVSPSG
jgi:precorrin-6A synthase